MLCFSGLTITKITILEAITMKIIAHRGFSSRAPENTMAAFLAAIEFGVDGLELDVHRSKDGKLVVCHDEKVDRTTNGKGNIADLTWDELQRFDAGSWFSPQFTGEKIPDLDSVLQEVKRAGILINIEIKSDIFAYPGLEAQVVQSVQKFDLVDQCIISSFNHYTLVRISEVLPELMTAILYVEHLYKPWDYVQPIKAKALHPNYRSVTPEAVACAKQKGIIINPWTVNDWDSIRQMFACGVNAVITNYPDRAREVLTEKTR
jgi:glycerophosphoryl diester phosphodiesterase